MGSKLVRPAALEPGSRVGLVAPAGPMIEPDDVERAVATVRDLGCDPVVGRHANARYGYLAGTDDQRVEDFNDAIADRALDAVWCLRGGYGTPRLLHRIDFQAVANHPTIVIGHSDITALLNGIVRCAGVTTFHGPVARAVLSSFSRDALTRVTTRTEAAGVLPLPPSGTGEAAPGGGITTVRGGTAEGPLFGGNLSLLNVLVGTPYMPDLDGALLFIEDVAEKVYVIDRMLAHLRLAGILDRLAGIIVGQFTGLIRETSTGILEFEEVIDSHCGSLGIPVASGFPVGHVPDQWTLPLGVTARLDADAGTVNLLESAVA